MHVVVLCRSVFGPYIELRAVGKRAPAKEIDFRLMQSWC